MKKSFLTFAAIALVFSFTSCKETTTETTEESAVEVIETRESSVEVEAVTALLHQRRQLYSCQTRMVGWVSVHLET
jgi:hypothetical protein